MLPNNAIFDTNIVIFNINIVLYDTHIAFLIEILQNTWQYFYRKSSICIIKNNICIKKITIFVLKNSIITLQTNRHYNKNVITEIRTFITKML